MDACVRLSGQPRGKLTFAVINEGYAVESGDKRWMFDQLSALAELFPGEIDLVDLLALDVETVAKRIAPHDVIFVLGGHTDYLMHVFQKTGFAERLPQLLTNKVYVGSSAGAMVLGKRINTAAYRRVYGEGDDYGVTKYMELVDFAMKPHFDAKEFPNNRSDVLLDISRTYRGHIFGLKDTQAIAVGDKKTQFIGEKPICVSNGKVITSF